MATSKKKCPVVAILNMKGGVGKTTISAHVFRVLYYQLKKSVLLIDFDPQFNLTQQVIKETDYEAYKASGRTIASVMENNAGPSLFATSTKLGPAPAVADVSVRLRYITQNPDINLSLVPGDFLLAKYSLIGESKVLKPVKERFLEFIDNARQERDLLCIDCNPSSSFMTVCALQAATHVLVPVRPDRFSVLGLKILSKFINDLDELEPKPKLMIMMNGIPTSKYDPTVENTVRSDPDFGPVTMVNSLHTSKVLEATVGYTGFASDKKQSWRVTPNIAAIVTELGKLLKL